MRDVLRSLFGVAPVSPFPPAPANLDETSLSLTQRFCWHLVQRSRSARFIECSLGRPATLSIWHGDWPGDNAAPCIIPDAQPILSRRDLSSSPRHLLSSLRTEPLNRSVVQVSGLETFSKSGLPFDTLRHLLQNARYLVLCANPTGPDGDQVRNEFAILCRRLEIHPAFMGESNQGCFAIGGREAAAPVGVKPTKALALMCTYNEEDVVEQAIQALFAQGLDVFVVDDGSTDRTVERLEAIAKSSPRLTFDKETRKGSHYYEKEPLFCALLNHANCAAANGYEWMMYLDPDEIRCSPWPGITLADSFAHIEHLGYNAVDFTVIDFRYAKDQQMTSASYESQMPWFEFGLRHGHFIQIKAWRHTPGLNVDLYPSHGHEAHFAGRRVFPLKFLLKHYPLRGLERARKKIFQDRFTRYDPKELAKGVHVQYNAYRNREPEGWNPNDLLLWDDRFHSRYLLERLSGIGLDRKL